MTKRFKGQSYSQIRRSQLKKKELFVDPEFPAANASLFLNIPNISGRIEWKRPKVKL